MKNAARKKPNKSARNAGGPPQEQRSPADPPSPSPFYSRSGPSIAADISKRLRAWFRRHGRDLPWRNTRDPYRVLVSELMLQQTQVSRVIDYYSRFLDRFPTIESLAAAPPRRVMESWRGLGYYARARNLHTLARTVQREGGGRLPHDVDELRQLPGVGRYTAGAVASFAYERSAPLVDTNVARVLGRIFAPDLSPKSGRDLTQLWEIATAIVPRNGKAAWSHNQALMELGALVCTARVRHCARCPVNRHCLSADDHAVADDSPGSPTNRGRRKNTAGRTVKRAPRLTKPR